MKEYLDHDKGVVVFADLGVADGLVFIVDVYPFQPLGSIEEVILGHVERHAVDGGDVEDIRDGLVVLGILLADLPDGRGKMRHVNLRPVPLYPLRLIMEVIAAVALHLRDEHRDVVRLELVRREYFGCGAVEVVLLGPGRFPGPN